MKNISNFHFITRELEGFSHSKQAELACKGGAEWIQLRVKDRPFEEWLEIAYETKKICTTYQVRLIINDQVSIAKEILADGVHLGKLDMPPSKARVILGKDAIIGATANNYADVAQAYSEGADYIGLGPYKHTLTKLKLSPVLGYDGLQRILEQMERDKMDLPLVAIGGIELKDLEVLKTLNVHGVAAASALGFERELCDQVLLWTNYLNQNFVRSRKHKLI